MAIARREKFTRARGARSDGRGILVCVAGVSGEGRGRGKTQASEISKLETNRSLSGVGFTFSLSQCCLFFVP